MNLSRSAGRAANFLRRHSRALSVVGASFVFVTFVVKDNLRDERKSLADSIDSAESIFILRSEIAINLEELRTLRKDFLEFRNHPDRFLHFHAGGFSESSDTGWGFDPRELEVDQQQELNTQASVDNTERLLRKVPGNQDERTRLAHLQDTIREFWAGKNDIDNQVQRKKAENYNADLDFLEDSEEALTRNVRQTSSAADALARDVLRDAEIERGRSEKSYEVWNAVSWLVYLLAGAIAVSGVLAGIDTKIG